MRARPTILSLVLLPCLAASPAEAQVAGAPYRSPFLANHPDLRRLAPGQRTRLGVFGSGRYSGWQTRTDQLRAISPIRRDRWGLLRDPRPTASPIKDYLDRRNLLKSRSPLGRRSSRLIGRLDYLVDPSGRWRGDVAVQPPVPSQVVAPERTSPPARSGYGREALSERADEYFELGAGYFRNGDLFSARHYFEKVADLESDRPRALIADVFVSHANAEYNRAVASLLLALDRAGTLDELRIDRFIESFYQGDDLAAKQRAFSRTVERVNLFAQSQPDAPLVNLLLAYFAWLNGDLGTAVAATEVAEKALDDTFVPRVRRFRQLLIQARDKASVGTPGT